MTQQFTKNILEVLPTAIGKKEIAAPASDTALIQSGAGKLSLKESFERFKKFGECRCDYSENVNIPNSDVTIVQCPVCKNEKRRFYS